MPRNATLFLSQKRGVSTWTDILGDEHPIEIFEGKRKPISNLQSYIQRGYKFSENRKEELKKAAIMKKFIGALMPDIQEQFLMTRRINFKK